MKNYFEPEDFVGAGFHKIDDDKIELRPPKINWGVLLDEASDEVKVERAQKVASAMNHAARLIQDERDQLNELLGQKEEQLKQMSKAMEQNQQMLVSEVTRLNEDRQEFLKTIADLKRRLREHGDNC
jgi:ABC-type transporter Mla subunit MlaD